MVGKAWHWECEVTGQVVSRHGHRAMNGSAQKPSLFFFSLGPQSTGMTPLRFRVGLMYHLTQSRNFHTEVCFHRDFRYCQVGHISHHRPLPLGRPLNNNTALEFFAWAVLPALWGLAYLVVKGDFCYVL